MKYIIKQKFNSVFQYFHKRNKGSTLVTVIVVIAFLSILATVMLYLAGENFKTKVIDQQTKESFYEAEEVVELIKCQLIVDVSEATVEACSITGSDFIKTAGGDDKTLASLREVSYLNNFRNCLINEWGSHFSIDHSSLSAAGNGVYDLFFEGSNPAISETVISETTNESGEVIVSFPIKINGESLLCKIEGIGEGTNLLSGKAITDGLLDDDNKANPYIINRLTITVTNEKSGYSSIVSTEFLISPPEINWNSSIAGSSDVIDYSDYVMYSNWRKD